MRVYCCPPSLLESRGWAVENFQNLEGKGLKWKIFRNKELARFWSHFPDLERLLSLLFASNFVYQRVTDKVGLKIPRLENRETLRRAQGRP